MPWIRPALNPNLLILRALVLPVSNTKICWPATTKVQGPPRLSSGMGEPAPHTAMCNPSGKSLRGSLPMRCAVMRLATAKLRGSRNAYRLPASSAMTIKADPSFPIRMFKLQKFWPFERQSLESKVTCNVIWAEWPH